MVGRYTGNRHEGRDGQGGRQSWRSRQSQDDEGENGGVNLASADANDSRGGDCVVGCRDHHTDDRRACASDLQAPSQARAVSRHHREIRTGTVPYHALLLEDADTGRIIYDYNGGIEWPPASMAKMMLLLVATEQIKAGRFQFGRPGADVRANAAFTGGSRLGLRAGEADPARRVDEGRAYPFGQRCRGGRGRRDLRLDRTLRRDDERAREESRDESHGLRHGRGLAAHAAARRRRHHGVRPGETLARALIHQTDLLQWSSMATAPFDNGAATLHNTNRLIGHFEGADGLKTGFTLKAGFNLTATAERGNMRLIAVVLGAPSNAQRFAQGRQTARLGLRQLRGSMWSSRANFRRCRCGSRE